jgi:hypothetical protein
VARGSAHTLGRFRELLASQYSIEREIFDNYAKPTIIRSHDGATAKRKA